LFRGRPQDPVHVGVHDGDYLGWRPRTAGHRGPHLVEPLPAMRDVVVEHTHRVGKQRAVAGKHHAQAGVGGQRPQAVQASQVVAE